MSARNETLVTARIVQRRVTLAWVAAGHEKCCKLAEPGRVQDPPQLTSPLAEPGPPAPECRPKLRPPDTLLLSLGPL